MGLLCKSLRDGANQELWLRSLKLWAEKGSTAASSDRLWRCECLRQRGVVFWASNSLRISKMAPLSISPSSPSFFPALFRPNATFSCFLCSPGGLRFSYPRASARSPVLSGWVRHEPQSMNQRLLFWTNGKIGRWVALRSGSPSSLCSSTHCWWVDGSWMMCSTVQQKSKLHGTRCLLVCIHTPAPRQRLISKRRCL